MAHWIVTANRLSDGGVTYLRADNGWTERLCEAWKTEEREQAEARLRWAATQQRVVCDPYVLEVAVEQGAVVVGSARERIRAEGPGLTLQRLGYAWACASPRRAAAG